MLLSWTRNVCCVETVRWGMFVLGKKMRKISSFEFWDTVRFSFEFWDTVRFSFESFEFWWTLSFDSFEFWVKSFVYHLSFEHIYIEEKALISNRLISNRRHISELSEKILLRPLRKKYKYISTKLHRQNYIHKKISPERVNTS